MAGVLFFKVFEIEGWEVRGVLGWGHGMAEVVVELEILGRQCADGEVEDQHKDEAYNRKEGLFHTNCFHRMNVCRRQPEARNWRGNLPEMAKFGCKPMNSNSIDIEVFAGLFREACFKCFGHVLSEPLTETESRHLYYRILEETGLIIGWKSIKNYSLFVLSGSPGRQENPSVATLDTLSRYVLGAPYTTEPERKKGEGIYSYWYRYKEQWLSREGAGVRATGQKGGEGEEGEGEGRRRNGRWVLAGGLVFVGFALLIIILTFFFRSGGAGVFVENFHSLAEDSLVGRGWRVASKDTVYWMKRGDNPGNLTLYTLKGDNWPDPVQAPVIRNLLVRSIPCDCFTAELHLKDFIPRQNWQQAGILLSEDTGFTGKSIRVSIVYNDYSGGYPMSGSILLQAITSPGIAAGKAGLAPDKPEEIAHFPLVNADTLARHPLLAKNLEHSALRIEKQGDRFRILYADGILENTSFKEIVSHSFSMRARYAGLFALKGFVDSADIMPVRFSYFSLHCETCTVH